MLEVMLKRLVDSYKRESINLPRSLEKAISTMAPKITVEDLPFAFNIFFIFVDMAILFVFRV